MNNIRFVKGQRNSRRKCDVDNHSEGMQRMEPIRKSKALIRWKFKSCPKCHGDLNSSYGEDFSCFQCGYIEYRWIKKEGGYNGKTKEG